MGPTSTRADVHVPRELDKANRACVPKWDTKVDIWGRAEFRTMAYASSATEMETGPDPLSVWLRAEKWYRRSLRGPSCSKLESTLMTNTR